jgi:polar amino acid transport system substrate-binding protein
VIPHAAEAVVHEYRVLAAAVALVGLLVVLSYESVLCEGPEPTPRPPPLVADPSEPQGNVLSFCSDPWSPYAGKEDSPTPGYIVQVLREIYGNRDYTVLYVNRPWSRCLEDVRSGRLTGLAGADVLEVPDFVFPDYTIGVTLPTFFARPTSTWRYRGLASLAEIRLGSIQDYTYERGVDQYIRNAGSEHRFLVRGNDPLERLLAALNAGYIDAFIENGPVVGYTLRQMGLDPAMIKAVGQVPGLKLFVPFSPVLANAENLADMFDDGIVELRATGRLPKILARYGLTDWDADGAP